MQPTQTFAEYPEFGNASSKQKPGDAKYSAGFLPQETLPAEWQNWFLNGATKGITDLNTGVLSIESEINTVLTSRSETPDATKTNQLLTVLNKIRDEAVACSHPIGTVYMNALCSTLPASISVVGTWVEINEKFLRGCSACIRCSGGSATATLAVCHLPSHSHDMNSHTHDFTPSGTVSSHCHTGPSHTHCLSGTNATANTCTLTGSFRPITGTNGRSNCPIPSGIVGTCTPSYNACNGDASQGSANWVYCINATHSHSLSGYTCAAGTGNTGATQPSFTGTAGTTGEATGNTGNTGSGCSFDILPPYRNVAMWYRCA